MFVFVSYKSEYRDDARLLRNQLHSWGHSTWFDADDIPPGGYWRDEIQKALMGCDIVVGMITPEALKSREVQWEWDYGIHHGKFIPVRWSNVILPYHLQGSQYIDVVSDRAKAFDQLKQRLTESAKASPVTAVAEESMITKAKSSVPSFGTSTAAKNDDRTRLLEKVHDAWIIGVLNHALKDNEFELNMTLKADAVLKHRRYGDYELPTSVEIYQIFEDMGRELLILGAPGAGKTVLLLQLTRTLLEKAAVDDTLPIPVVFNLASWADKRTSLDSWLIERLYIEYQVPRKLGRHWIDDEKLLLLFDGLDEVKIDSRNDCVQAINDIRNQYRTIDIAVCSRVIDYENLTNQLHLEGALLLQPLSPEQVNKLLQRDDLQSLRQISQQEEHLEHMLTTPFLLNTIAYTYSNMSSGEIGQYSSETDRRNHLFDHFVKHRFNQNSNDNYTLAQTRNWLSWLASNMDTNKQSVFFLESMGWNWLQHHWQRKFYRPGGVLIGLIIGAFCGLVNGYALGRLVDLVSIGSAVGLAAGGVIGSVAGFLLTRNEEIRSADILTWSFSLQHLLKGMVVGGLIGATIAIVVASANEMQAGIVGGLIMGSCFGVIVMLSLGLHPDQRIQTRSQPNEGMIRTLKNAVAYGISTGVIVPLLSLLILMLLSFLALVTTNTVDTGIPILVSKVWSNGIYSIILTGFLMGIGSGLAAAMLFGVGDQVAKNLFLRIFLIHAGCTPFNYVHFLNFAARIGVLRRVGGGYIFTHRMLLEYFAEYHKQGVLR